MYKILILDDERAICDSLEFALEDEYKIYTALNPEEAYQILSEIDIDILLLDLKIGDVDGLDVLRKVKETYKDVKVIIMTAYGSIKSSVEAIKSGALHYITKPLDIEELKVYIQKAIKYKQITSSLSNLQEIVNNIYSFSGIIGESHEIKEVIRDIKKVKDIDSTVLVLGESGTGKDLVSKAIHFQGNRKSMPFQVVNCAAIPNTLLESELFGYEKGAFTGADKRKLGKIQLADGGTLFLDEIGEMDMYLQAKILRIVEDKKVTPLGGEKEKEVDVRIIAATNKNLEEEIRKGNFREDLYYRLNVLTIEIPPLRERKEDILLLANHFLLKYKKNFNKDVRGFTKEAKIALEAYHYPGNVRELENIIERAVVLTESELISLDDLPKHISGGKREPLKKNGIFIEYGTSMQEVEKALIIKTLKYFDGDKKKTAEVLGISERNLYYKLKEYNK